MRRVQEKAATSPDDAATSERRSAIRTGEDSNKQIKMKVNQIKNFRARQDGDVPERRSDAQGNRGFFCHSRTDWRKSAWGKTTIFADGAAETARGRTTITAWHGGRLREGKTATEWRTSA